LRDILLDKTIGPRCIVRYRTFISYLCFQFAEILSNMPEDRSSLKELDRWVSYLMECQQLPEGQVKTLCEKVGDCFDIVCFVISLVIF